MKTKIKFTKLNLNSSNLVKHFWAISLQFKIRFIIENMFKKTTLLLQQLIISEKNFMKVSKFYWIALTHRPIVPHLCVFYWVSIGSDNGGHFAQGPMS